MRSAKYQILLLAVVLNNRYCYNIEEHQERMAPWRYVAGAEQGHRHPHRRSGAGLFHFDGFGPVAEPDQLGLTLDKAIAVVESGKPAAVDVIAQPR